MYIFYEPRLRACNENTLTSGLSSDESIALAVSPDQSAAEARQKLISVGFRKITDLRVIDPRIELYRR